jgi:hypothetical protein
MADELPGEPNMEVAPYIFSRVFSTCAEKGKFLEWFKF